MKIVIDLQCCQTEARLRGIGRYAKGLTESIVTIGTEHDFVFLLNRKYLDRSKDIVADIARWDQIGHIAYYDYPDVQRDWPERTDRENIGNILRNDRIESLSPDVFYSPSIFEGESVWGSALAYITFPSLPIIRSATIYDFIPLRYPDKYLKDWPVAQWYRRTLAAARQLDVALAISETTKDDAHKFLDIPSSSIVNIYGGVDDCFRILPAGKTHTGAVWERLDPNESFILYLGGPDPRKNLNGALEAFALANRALRSRFKFVLAFEISTADELQLRQRAGELGIANSIRIVGFVDDTELVELYNACALFIFPSLFEGLGLPVIEAMRCGAPVLVGDNSSLREIVTEPNYRFDASNPQEIANTIIRALSSDDIRARMREYSLKRGNEFGWQRSGRLALDAWQQAYADQNKRSSIAIPKQTPRLAMFTPLPPAQSGIADYSANFIPVLARYASMDIFVEDIASLEFICDGVSILHHTAFPFRADSYDAIIYQLGNSPFHHYMLPYTQRFPGLIVMHDAYVGHLSHDPGNPDAFLRQAIRDHDGSVRRYLDSDTENTAGKVIDSFTCSATHIHRSKGVIVHSNFAKTLLMRSCNPLVAPEIHVITQYVAAIEAATACGRKRARDALHLPYSPIILATFGHVAPTKGVLELIDAFKLIRQAGVDARLIMVGALEGDGITPTPFARMVLEAIAGRGDIAITGYVEQATYDLYLQAIDFGIQLRTLTRGETSRAMMTFIINGIPFIHNRLGASVEIPADVAYGIDDCDPKTIADAIRELIDNHARRRSLVEASLKFARDTMAPDVAGPRFVSQALSMTRRSRTCGPANVAAAVARVLSGVTPTQELIRHTAQSFVRQERSEDTPRLLIDVTHIREHDLRTGVQRVVRELTRAAYRRNDGGLRAQTFAFTEDALVYADDFAQQCGALLPVEKPDARTGRLRLRPFDKMLLADGSWHLSNWMAAPLEELDSVAGGAFALVHDILPLQHPDLFPDHVADSLYEWLALILRSGDGLICTSQTAADDLASYIKDNQLPVRPGFRIGYQRLGADFLKSRAMSPTQSPLVRELVERRNIFLVVGTIEPRKGHSIILDAFERLWNIGTPATLVFVGKQGWNVDDLLGRILSHPELNRAFFFLESVGDCDLSTLYEHAFAVIVASIAEGFGLPIYEAANAGAPLVLSDLPVFKELAGPDAHYFENGSAESLATVIQHISTQSVALKSPKNIDPPTWDMCSKGIFGFMSGYGTYLRF